MPDPAGRPSVSAHPWLYTPAEQQAFVEELDAELQRAREELESMSPEQREARFLQTVSKYVAQGKHVPAQMMEAARAKGWTPPAEQTLDQVATGRIGGAGWTPDKQRQFLVHLMANGVVAHACRAVGLSKQSAHALRARHPSSVFAILWDVAVRAAKRHVLDEATERALHGREETVWHRGEEVGTRRVFSDRLLMNVLRHEAPPAHPNLSQRELEELWSSLLTQVDVDLPPGLPMAKIADLGDRERDDGAAC